MSPLLASHKSLDPLHGKLKNKADAKFMQKQAIEERF
jgi:hypothetical protein